MLLCGALAEISMKDWDIVQWHCLVCRKRCPSFVELSHHIKLHRKQDSVMTLEFGDMLLPPTFDVESKGEVHMPLDAFLGSYQCENADLVLTNVRDRRRRDEDELLTLTGGVGKRKKKKRGRKPKGQPQEEEGEEEEDDEPVISAVESPLKRVNTRSRTGTRSADESVEPITKRIKQEDAPGKENEPAKNDSPTEENTSAEQESPSKVQEKEDASFPCNQCDYTCRSHNDIHVHLFKHKDESMQAKCPFCKNTVSFYRLKKGQDLKTSALANTPKSPPVGAGDAEKASEREPTGSSPAKTSLGDHDYRSSVPDTPKTRAPPRKSDEADTSMARVEEIEKEARVEKVKRSYKCLKCDWASEHHYSYHRHLFCHVEGDPQLSQVECTHCTKTMTMQLGRVDYGSGKQDCPLCDFLNKTVRQLRAHLMEVHGMQHRANQNVYICRGCQFSAFDPEKVAHHISAEHDGIIVLDDDPMPLSVAKTSEGELEGEEGEAGDQDGKFVCPRCSWRYADHDTFHVHLVSHPTPDGEPHLCDYCHLQLHVVTQDSPDSDRKNDDAASASSRCPLCPRKPANETALRNHVILRHEKNAPAGLHKAFPWAREMSPASLESGIQKIRKELRDQNYIDRTGRPSFTCDTCGWTTRRHFSLHRHLFTHSGLGVSPHCSHCHKTLAITDGQTGYGVRKFDCDLCDFGPVVSAVLSQHMKSAHPESLRASQGRQPVTCPLCHYTCLLGGVLKRHVVSAHGTEKAMAAFRDGGLVNDDVSDGQLMENISKIAESLRSEGQGQIEIQGQGESKTKRAKSGASGSPRLYVCEACGHQTRRLDLLEQHRQTEHSAPADSLRCDQCDFTSMTSYGLKRHQLTMHRASRVPCRHCDVTFLTGRQCQNHLQQVHGVSDFSRFCVDCASFVPATEDLTSHRQRHLAAENVLYVCAFCETSVDSKESLLRHQTGHPDADKVAIGISGTIRPFSCSHCGAKFSQAPELVTHLASVHDVTEDVVDPDWLRCDQCAFKTDSTLRFRRHKANHLRSKHQVRPPSSFICPHCRDRVKTISDLQRHLSKVHGTKSQRVSLCKQCGEVFSSVHALKTHRRETHIVHVVFVCDFCQQTFHRRWNLLRHRAIKHLNRKIEKCVYCDYSNEKVPRLIAHYRRGHLMEPPSSLLDKVKVTPKPRALLPERKLFLKKKKLAMQYRNTTARFPKVCDQCKMTVHRSHLKAHQALHRRQKPFHCHHPGCDFATRVSSLLPQHIRRKHLQSANERHGSKRVTCPRDLGDRRHLVGRVRPAQLEIGTSDIAPATTPGSGVPISGQRQPDGRLCDLREIAGSQVVVSHVTVPSLPNIRPALFSDALGPTAMIRPSSVVAGPGGTDPVIYVSGADGLKVYSQLVPSPRVAPSDTYRHGDNPPSAAYPSLSPHVRADAAVALDTTGHVTPVVSSLDVLTLEGAPFRLHPQASIDTFPAASSQQPRAPATQDSCHWRPNVVETNSTVTSLMMTSPRTYLTSSLEILVPGTSISAVPPKAATSEDEALS